jgi:uncharacterized NAD(P)/FAD-binding protein YdhS
MKQVVIIGGGFSGCLTAINLSRLGTGPLKITIINQGYPLGRGVAYSTRNSHHLLNVVARNMSALADQPTHFVEWLRTRSEYRDESAEQLRERFVPRRIYGDYLLGLFFYGSAVAAEKGIQIETIAAEATDVGPAFGGASVVLSNGQFINANRVVLATGHQPPANLKIIGLDAAHPRYFQNPWQDWENRLSDRTENVILIGTGLTMIDVFLSLKDLDWKGRIYAVSRNGLLPLSHFKGVEYGDLIGGKSGPLSLAQIYGIFKKHFRSAKAQGINPLILVDKLRPVTPHLWQNLSLREKRRFNRHFRTRWNVARHRIAQSIHQQLAEAVATQRLEIVKGRLWKLDPHGERLALTVKTGNEYRRIESGALINCTGPCENFSTPASPLFRNLFSRGLIQADEMDMGIKVTPEFAVIEQTGKTSDLLLALGPLLKGTLWESIAVPELRSQAFKVAETLAKQLSETSSANIKESVQAVLEYEI